MQGRHTLILLAVYCFGCRGNTAAVPLNSATTIAAAEVDWATSGEYESGPWRLSYTCADSAVPDRPGLRWGHLAYGDFDLNLSNEHINDRICTPWGVLHWAGTWRHPWGYQGWGPRPADSKRHGPILTPGQVLAIQILEEPYHVWRPRLQERLQLVLGDIPEPETGITLVHTDYIVLMARAFQRVLNEAPGYSTTDAEAQPVRRLTGAPERASVMRIAEHLVVVIAEGHPMVDGWSALIVVDAAEGKVAKSATTGYGRQRLSAPTTMPAQN